MLHNTNVWITEFGVWLYKSLEDRVLLESTFWKYGWPSKQTQIIDERQFLFFLPDVYLNKLFEKGNIFQIYYIFAEQRAGM